MSDWPILKYFEYVIEARVSTIIFFCVIREDVDNLYKWQTFQSSSLPQRQISHVDNNITIMHKIYSVFIDMIRSHCSIIDSERGYVRLEKVSQADVSKKYYCTSRWGLLRSAHPEEDLIKGRNVEDSALMSIMRPIAIIRVKNTRRWGTSRRH